MGKGSWAASWTVRSTAEVETIREASEGTSVAVEM
jgi:hypothetical protein